MRTPLTIWRYALIELARLVLLTTTILVVVIVFAAAVRYTAAGKLGPLETLRFMGLAMVPMLQYALPFAAGFGATLAYHRLAQDNELKAAAASGVSHRALLGPALGAGIVLSLFLGILTAEVIPGFLRGMQRMVTQDMTKMVINSIRSGQSLDFDGRMIHADNVRELAPEPPFSSVLLLTGVTGLEVDEAGVVVKEITATHALIGFSHGHGEHASAGAGSDGTLVTLVLRNWTGWERGKAEASGEELLPVSMPMPGGLDDDPKFLTSRELARLPSNPDVMNIIDTRRQELAYRIAERQCTATIDASLRASGSVRMKDEAGRGYIIHAGGVRWSESPGRWELVPARGRAKVEVDVFREEASGSAGPALRYEAASAGLGSDMSRDAWSRSLSLYLDMEGVVASAAERGGEQSQRRITKLIPEESPLDSLLELSSAELLAKVAADDALRKDGFVAGPAHELQKRIRKLNREIVSKQHERAAISISCAVMVLAGALTAMRLAGSLPLTVYLWSFFPALISVITISAGQQTTHQVGMAGLVILWSGVALLVAYVAIAFASVRRH